MDGVMKVFAKRAVNLTLRYLEGDPQENLSKAVNTLMPLAKRDTIKRQLESAKQIMAERDNPYRNLILRVFNEIAPNVRRRFVTNFVVNASMIGPDRAQMLKYKHDCNIPWAILMDPTSACNLHCKGCWAAEYNKTDSMDYALLDRIIREGKELGVYFYIYSGGEPTIRKNDLIKLAQVHNDCMFLAFTNGSLVDQDFALALAEVGNFALAFSIEGFEEATDFRRGAGTYAKVIEAMQYMKQIGAPFGFSAVYHGQNTEQVGNEAFLDFLIEQGCMFGWYFTYIPLGKDADTALIASPSQREYMFHWVREMRDKKPIFLLDFWNDGQYSDGCIAGGRRYLHINSAGDVEPCAFIHYSNVNIRNVSLLEALKSPLLKQYKELQPFNKNHLRPCPLLDNPEALSSMVKASGAYSTQPIDKEDVDELTAKCEKSAKEWAPVADGLWAEESLEYSKAKARREEEEQKIQEQIMKQLKKMRPLKTKEDKKKLFSLRL